MRQKKNVKMEHGPPDIGWDRIDPRIKQGKIKNLLPRKFNKVGNAKRTTKKTKRQKDLQVVSQGNVAGGGNETTADCR